ncbi:hypothetical protein EK21DRAFT_99736 [Setomelanomma holmii]|uniref:Apple domain-containing protein n=1 Tax=Setomelanomma holmii TaxID=210430 RepID=A0A9P4HB86_9PLEO|nr:hypothetical protein EK21DRAFT_99736 [Setomelanomma holmii]
MLVSIVLATLSVLPVISAQDVTSSATRCTTRFGYYPLPTGSAAVPTWFAFTTTVDTFSVTYTTCDTVTTTTTTSVPVSTTIPTPSGFLPLLAANLAGPTAGGLSRFKRYDIQGRDAATAAELVRRQTAANNTGGFHINRNGQSSDIYCEYPQRVDCRVSVTINSTITTVVTALPETVLVPASTVDIVSTSTVSVTSTVEVVAPRRTVYAACLDNNVVNSVTGAIGNTLIFDSVIYRPAQGFPIENELILNATSAENCCIACQNTAYCAGSFYVPSNPDTCPAGSLSLYLGTIEGQEDFPFEYALSFSNGRCGRFSVWPIPITDTTDTSVEDVSVQRI